MNWKEYVVQNVKAVDMCAAAICLHRSKHLPLKAIHLIPKMYDQFKSWTEKNLERELLPDEKIQFDEVNIEKGWEHQSTPLVLEMWEENVGVSFKPKMGIA